MKAVAFVTENGEKRAYITGAPRNEDCARLAQYFKKHWDARCETLFDVGTDARYRLRCLGQDCALVHGQLGTYITCSTGDVEAVLKAPLTDLERRLGAP